MAVEDRLETVRTFLDQVKRYAILVSSNSFSETTLEELKTNAKGTCDDIKAEVDLIKTDIDAWGG